MVVAAVALAVACEVMVELAITVLVARSQPGADVDDARLSRH